MNYEDSTTRSVRIQIDDGTSTYSESVTISITNVDDIAPTDLSLSSSAMNENAGANGVVGTISYTTVEVGDSATYSLVAGTGDTDNGLFNISGNSLRATSSLNYEDQASRSVRIQIDDGTSTYEESFTITVLVESSLFTNPLFITIKTRLT